MHGKAWKNQVVTRTNWLRLEGYPDSKKKNGGGKREKSRKPN